jgi:threonine synthase
MAKEHNLRIVSGNGPIRTEGYKSEAFEIYEQLGLDVPEYIAIPTSACGHIRGVFKGFKELLEAGYIKRLPKMVVVQAQNNSPIVSAIKSGKDRIIPFSNFHTIAEAITSGTPQGGDEIVQKANQYGWLAEDVTEEEIIESQRLLAGEGLFVEPASATSLAAVKKLHASGLIKSSDRVVLILTGSGLKDSGACSLDQSLIHNPQLQNLQKSLNIVLDQLNK